MVLTALTASLAMAAWSQPETSLNDPERGFGFLLGYRAINIRDTYAHDTHPDDFFLPNANVPGSAGTTTIDGTSSFALVGFRFQPAPIEQVWTLNFDAGALLGGQRDDHQNVNDPRPPSNGAFIYEEARFGMMFGTGASYNFHRLSLGLQAEVYGVFVDRGWDRYSQDQSANTKLDWEFGIGPKVGFRFSEYFRAEAGVLFGGHQPTGIVNLILYL
jgi:hypothetical protein